MLAVGLQWGLLDLSLHTAGFLAWVLAVGLQWGLLGLLLYTVGSLAWLGCGGFARR